MWRRQATSTLSPPLEEETIGSYASGMKTTVSIPDDVFAEAERLACRMGMSRNQLYSRALAEYVARHAPDRVTEAMDRVCAKLGQPTDSFVSTASRRILARSDW